MIMENISWNDRKILSRKVSNPRVSVICGAPPYQYLGGRIMKLSVIILVAAALFVAGVAQARHGHAQTVTLFGASTPKTPIDPDTNSVTLGVQFRSTQAGTIKGVRFYRASRST